MRLGVFLQQLSESLREVESNPHLTAELFLAACLGCTTAQLYSRGEVTLSEQQHQRLQQLVIRRLRGEPVAYILGYKEFWSLSLTVNHAVLIPRPETELLVEVGLAKFSKQQQVRVADLGTGSGAIALALASECPDWQIVATDCSNEALACARDNAEKLGYAEKIQFFQGDFCEPLTESYHLLLSNPPYLAADDPHLQDLVYEPTLALIADDNGFAAYRRILQQIKDQRCLASGGWLLFEHGYQQSQQLRELCKQYGYTVFEQYDDLSMHPRVLAISKDPVDL